MFWKNYSLIRFRLIYFFCCFLIFCNAQSNLQFTSGCEDISDCVDDICVYNSPIFEVEATTDCSLGSTFIYSHAVDIDNDGVFDFTGSGNQVNFTDEIGTHKILFEVSDLCGTVISCEKLVTVEDCTPPFLQCFNTNFFSFPPDDTLLTIYADSLNIASITDNCTEVEDLIFSFSDSIYLPTLTFSCSDFFQSTSLNLEIFVTDGSGNQSTCSSIAFINDEMGACYLQLFDSIPICVTYADLVPMENYQINNFNLTDDPDSDCKWYIPNTGFTEIKPNRNTNPRNGLTILDVILIQKHHLQIQPFDDPLKNWAGDINNNGCISAFDIVIILQALLKEELSIPLSWLFVDANYDLPVACSASPYPNSFLPSEIDSTDFPLEFIGVKAGDVDYSVDISEQTNGFLKPPVDTLTFFTEDKMLEAGTEINIPIGAKNFNKIAGFIFTINTDTTKLELLNGSSGEVFYDLGTSNFFNGEKGKTSSIWLDNGFSGVTASEEDTLFNLTFEVLENVLLSEAFSLNDSFVEMDVYDINEERLAVEFEYSDFVSTTENLKRTLEIEVFPNPFNEYTEIFFQLSEREQVTVEFFDVSGRKIRTLTQNFPSGLNSFLIKKSDLPSDGLYFFEVKTTENIGVGKMIVK